MSKTSVKKVVVSSNVIEVYEYENPCWYEFKGQGGRVTGEYQSDRVEENRKLTTRRAREKIRRLALCNFDNCSKFITLTFRDGAVQDVTSVEQCNIQFKKFIRRLKEVKGFKDLKYIAVIEFQDKNGRGAVHYHMICDIPYVKQKELVELWGKLHQKT